MSKKEKITVAATEIPEVAGLLEVERSLHVLIESNPQFYAELQRLANQRNELLKVAELKVKDLGVTCGPFIKISESQKIDAEKLFEELGEDAFKDSGGYTETVVDYKIDRTRFLSYLKSGAIPKEVADVCVKVTQSYKKPDPYSLP